jgi:hypothetical protein
MRIKKQGTRESEIDFSGVGTGVSVEKFGYVPSVIPVY